MMQQLQQQHQEGMPVAPGAGSYSTLQVAQQAALVHQSQQQQQQQQHLIPSVASYPSLLAQVTVAPTQRVCVYLPRLSLHLGLSEHFLAPSVPLENCLKTATRVDVVGELARNFAV